jgi:hypothetical protein
MKQYWEIPGVSKAPRQPCIAFHKYDGSNLRWEWSKKRGWYKFGTRQRLFDETDPDFCQAIPLFLGQVGVEIEKIAKKTFRASKIIAFTEFFGPSSFVGRHKEEEEKELRLFDVCIDNKGIMAPRDFVRHFGSLPFAAEVVYEGNLNDQFISAVRAGHYPVVEGVVCKGGKGHKLWMAKIKTDAYRKRLIEVFGRDWQRFWE